MNDDDSTVQNKFGQCRDVRYIKIYDVNSKHISSHIIFVYYPQLQNIGIEFCNRYLESTNWENTHHMATNLTLWETDGKTVHTVRTYTEGNRASTTFTQSNSILKMVGKLTVGLVHTVQ